VESILLSVIGFESADICFVPFFVSPPRLPSSSPSTSPPPLDKLEPFRVAHTLVWLCFFPPFLGSLTRGPSSAAVAGSKRGTSLLYDFRTPPGGHSSFFFPLGIPRTRSDESPPKFLGLSILYLPYPLFFLSIDAGLCLFLSPPSSQGLQGSKRGTPSNAFRSL